MLKSKLDLVFYPKSLGYTRVQTQLSVFDFKSYYAIWKFVETGLVGRASKAAYMLEGFITNEDEERESKTFPLYRRVGKEWYLFVPHDVRIALLKATANQRLTRGKLEVFDANTPGNPFKPYTYDIGKRAEWTREEYDRYLLDTWKLIASRHLFSRGPVLP